MGQPRKLTVIPSHKMHKNLMMVYRISIEDFSVVTVDFLQFMGFYYLYS